MTDLTNRHKAILFIGLRNALGAARQLAIEFRDAMQMRQDQKKRYNDLITYLQNFSKGMIPSASPLTASQKRDMKGYDFDYTMVLMSAAMQLAVLDSDSIPKFMSEFEWLIDTYSEKNKKAAYRLETGYEIWQGETVLGYAKTPQEAWEQALARLKERRQEVKAKPFTLPRFAFRAFASKLNHSKK